MSGNWASKRIFKCIDDKKLGVDLVLIMNGNDKLTDNTFFYATQLLKGGGFEVSTCAIDRREGITIITSPLEEESASKVKGKVLVSKEPDDAKRMLKGLAKGHSKVGINAPELVYSNYQYMQKVLGKKVKLVDVSDAIRYARVVKSPDEIRTMKEACDIASRAYDELLPRIVPGARECDIAAELGYLMGKHGATGTAFTTICGFGPNAAEPHYSSGTTKLKEGGMLVLDFGATYDRYRSDITRTIPIGRPTAKFKRMYDVVDRAQKASLGYMRAGRVAKEVDAKARNVIDRSEFKGLFIHSLGHGLGLATHDPYGMSPRFDFKLEEGMVFTVEPGVYIPGYGGVRIEDDVVVRKNGVEVLTTAKKWRD